MRIFAQSPNYRGAVDSSIAVTNQPPNSCFRPLTDTEEQQALDALHGKPVFVEE